MSTFNSQTNPIGAANLISGERTVAQVTFPLTGDPETDLISGVHVLIAQLLPHSPGCSARALSYLAKRFQDQSDSMNRLQASPIWPGTPQLGAANYPPPYQTMAASAPIPQAEINEFQRQIQKIIEGPVLPSSTT